MNVEQAMKIIVKPYITEKTFAMIENENKICVLEFEQKNAYTRARDRHSAAKTTSQSQESARSPH